MPDNFEELLDAAVIPDVSIFEMGSDTSINQQFKFTEGTDQTNEVPLDVANGDDPRFDRFAERKFSCDAWREDAKEFFLKKMKDVDAHNRLFPNRKKEYEKHWVSILKKIERIDKQISLHGQVIDVGVYIYDAEVDSAGNLSINT